MPVVVVVVVDVAVVVMIEGEEEEAEEGQRRPMPTTLQLHYRPNYKTLLTLHMTTTTRVPTTSTVSFVRNGLILTSIVLLWGPVVTPGRVPFVS